MNNLARFNAKRKAQKRASARAKATPFAVIVYDKASGQTVEVKHFASYASATDYASIYNGNATMGAFIQ